MVEGARWNLEKWKWRPREKKRYVGGRKKKREKCGGGGYLYLFQWLEDLGKLRWVTSFDPKWKEPPGQGKPAEPHLYLQQLPLHYLPRYLGRYIPCEIFGTS